MYLRRGDNRQRRGDRIARKENGMKVYRIELITNETNKIAFGRTMYGYDFGVMLCKFYELAENEIGKARIAKCHLKFYNA